MKSKVSRYLLRGLAVVFVGFVLIQLVPYGRAHENPSVVQEPNWDSPETRALVERACFDCHSNETEWPWYSNIAPVSWLVQHDVEEGRSKLNFSTWGQGRNEADEAVEVVQEGEMPMPVFLIMHPEARLSAAEKDALIRGLAATVGGDVHEDD
ncbi:MAG: heme-binding domain-containing protein [Ardenticatenaceae bacterium]|nr:heme-binding domain-containing protein [Ardenticatenaceae bacterium]